MTTTSDASLTAGLCAVADHFPLGRPFGRVDGSSEVRSDSRPFGLRFAVDPPATPVDLTGFEYDPVRQIGVLREGETAVPLLRHTKRLSLRFGALDFIVTPDGDWTFLEVNPNGQWAWIEDATGQPIADTIAAALSEESR